MKGTEDLKTAIENELRQRAFKDPLFAEALKKENKNIDDCIVYVINSVKKTEMNGFTDEEIFSMAVHYYDEDKIDVGQPVQVQVVVNHKPLLSQSEINELKEKARAEVIEEEKLKMRGGKKPEAKKIEKPKTGSLF